MSQSIHDFHDDPRNAAILIWVNGALKPRAEAVVSVFDSGFVLGDGVWEGLRVVGGHPVFLDAHLDRLFEGAKAIALDIGLSRAALTQALYDTLAANGMRGDGVHIRLMVTRGMKRTPYQDPRVTIGPATVVIIAEWKNAKPETLAAGLTLFTVHVRRGFPPRRRKASQQGDCGEFSKAAARHHPPAANQGYFNVIGKSRSMGHTNVYFDFVNVLLVRIKL